MPEIGFGDNKELRFFTILFMFMFIDIHDGPD